MKLEQSFDVAAPLDVVWRALNDLERVAPCLPGATITGHDDDGTYHGEFKVKLGPTTAAYRGTIKITDSDESTHTATLAAKGSDKRGQGGATATIVNRRGRRGRRHPRPRGHRLRHHRPPGPLRPRRDDPGHLEQAAQNFATCLATRLAEGDGAATGGEVAAGEAAPEAAAGAGVTSAAATGGEIAAGDAAPEAAAGPAPAQPGATGGEVAAGAAAPEAAAGALGGGAAPDASWGAAPTAVAPPAAAAEPATADAEPLKVGGLFWSVLWERIKRLFGGGRK